MARPAWWSVCPEQGVHTRSGDNRFMRGLISLLKGFDCSLLWYNFAFWSGVCSDVTFAHGQKLKLADLGQGGGGGGGPNVLLAGLRMLQS